MIFHTYLIYYLLIVSRVIYYSHKLRDKETWEKDTNFLYRNSSLFKIQFANISQSLPPILAMSRHTFVPSVHTLMYRLPLYFHSRIWIMKCYIYALVRAYIGVHVSAYHLDMDIHEYSRPNRVFAKYIWCHLDTYSIWWRKGTNNIAQHYLHSS